MPGFVVSALKDYKEWFEINIEKVTATTLIIPWTKRKLEDAIAEGAEKAHLHRIRVHDFRHSHATLCLNSGINVAAVSERLGHEKVSTTFNMYNHTQKHHEKQLMNWLESSYKTSLAIPEDEEGR